MVEERSVLGLYQGGNCFEFSSSRRHALIQLLYLRVDSMRVCIIEALNGTWHHYLPLFAMKACVFYG